MTTVLSDWDGIALATFLVCWLGYTTLADRGPWRDRSITAAMNRHRLRWMQVACERSMRMVDTSILGNLITSISFYSSTTIFVIAGLVAGLGYRIEITAALADLPYVEAQTPAQWTLKVVILIIVFVYAFFKFAWAFRLANYCSILVGSIPQEDHTTAEAARRVESAARVSALFGHHFNQGIRAYFFALAAFGWFLHPWLFMAMSGWTVVILFRREFASRALQAVRFSWVAIFLAVTPLLTDVAVL